MAGVVAETLRFGNSRGGSEDFPVALEVLRYMNVAGEVESNAYLRWGVLKALTLLRLHRQELDEIA
eukprot:gene32578-41897_t